MSKQPAQTNEEKLREVIIAFAPEIYRVITYLEQYGVNPEILPPIIRSLANLKMGTGYGKIQIFMQDGRLTQIKGEESVTVEQEVIVTKVIDNNLVK